MRFVEVEGCRNFRDIGGYRLVDGGTTRWRTLYRSDFVSARAEPQLTALGVSDVIDIRTSFERNGEANERARHIALFDSIPKRWSEPDDLSVEAIAERYLGMLEEGAANVAEIARVVARSEGAVAIHCRAGRDRTGVVIASLLSLVGARPEDIAVDYALSSGRCEDEVPCDREAMEIFLVRVGEEYGSVRALVSLNEEEARALGARLCE